MLEKISYCKNYRFALLDLDLLSNSYRIACTNIQNFEEGENCASIISVEHTFEYDMKLFVYDMILCGSDMILLGSIFKFQEPSFMLISGLINFCVTNQVPQVFFKVVVGDLMLVYSYEFYDIIFFE